MILIDCHLDQVAALATCRIVFGKLANRGVCISCVHSKSPLRMMTSLRKRSPAVKNNQDHTASPISMMTMLVTRDETSYGNYMVGVLRSLLTPHFTWFKKNS